MAEYKVRSKYNGTYRFDLHAGIIVNLYFYKNEAGARVTLNGDRYRTMVNDFLFENIDGRDPGEM